MSSLSQFSIVVDLVPGEAPLIALQTFCIDGSRTRTPLTPSELPALLSTLSDLLGEAVPPTDRKLVSK